MSTPQKIYRECLKNYLSDSFITPESLERGIDLFLVMKEESQAIYNAMQIYGKQEYNQAIEDAAKNIKIEKIGNSGSWFDTGLDKQSILKLKK